MYLISDSNLSTTAKRIVEKIYKKYVSENMLSSFGSDPSFSDFTRYLASYRLPEDATSIQSFAFDNSVLFIGGEASEADLDLWNEEAIPTENTDEEEKPVPQPRRPPKPPSFLLAPLPVPFKLAPKDLSDSSYVDLS